MLGIAQCNYRVKRTDKRGRKSPRKGVPEIPVSLGDMIAVHRRSKGWRMSELAAKANVTKDTVREWEHGLSRPNAELLALVGEWLDIPASLLHLDNVGSSQRLSAE